MPIAADKAEDTEQAINYGRKKTTMQGRQQDGVDKVQMSQVGVDADRQREEKKKVVRGLEVWASPGGDC